MTPTPFDQRLLKIQVQELAPQPWSDEVVRALVGAFETNPWRPLDEMCTEPGAPWQRFDRDDAAGSFLRGRSLIVRAAEPPLFDGSLHSWKYANTVRVSMQAATYEPRGAAAAESWIARAIATLPRPSQARASADEDQMMFVREQELPPTAEPFGEVGWLHVLYPAMYAPVFERDVLLRAPCHRVEERDGGSIWMWNYEHPFHYDTPAARDTNAALRRYLDAHRRRP